MSRNIPGLIERLESATGPDKELDCLIYCAVAESPFSYYGDECVVASMGGFAARVDWKDMPHPTASIDAALTLVPKNCGVLLGDAGVMSADSGVDQRYDRFGSIVFNAPHSHRERGRCLGAPTLAIALCIAALKARAASPTTPDHAREGDDD